MNLTKIHEKGHNEHPASECQFFLDDANSFPLCNMGIELITLSAFVGQATT